MTDQVKATSKDAAPKRPSQKRGTGFPVVPLSEAARILKEAGKYGFEHTAASFATCMGHSTANSGAFRQRLAAFRDWGLVTGRGDMLTMTDIARKVAVPTDQAGERLALQQAFNNCDVFVGLYEQVAKGQPLNRERLGAQAVHDYGVAPSSKSKFAKSFVESLVAARLAEVDSQGDVILLESGDCGRANDGDLPSLESTTAEVEEPEPKRRHPNGDRGPSSAAPPSIRQSWPITGGEIVLEVRSEEALPATVFGAIGEVVTKLEALSSSLNQAHGSDRADDGGER